MKVVERMSGWLTHPRLPLFLGVLAFLLTLPSVAFGFFVDDQMHAFYLRGGDIPGGPRGIWDLYRFADGGEGTRRAIDSGNFPWWASPELRFGFLRPLSSLWVTADHLVFGPIVAHLTSCLAYGLLAYIVTKLLARIVPGAGGGLAALFFAVDDTHHFPVLWIANRHALTSAVLGFAALLLHLRRREDARGTVWLPPLLLGLAFASGESTVGVWPYIFAYAWWLDPGGRRAALRSLAPFAFVTAMWAIAFVAGGYGAAGSTLYLDPIGQPGAFAASIVRRLPILLMSQVAGVPADFFPLLPPEDLWKVLALAVAILSLLSIALYRLTRGHRAARALAFATIFTLVPCCATFPSDRLLLLSGLGAFGLLGIAIARIGEQMVARRASVPGRLLAAGLVFIHLVLAAPLLPIRTVVTALVFGRSIERGAATLPRDEAVREQTLVVVSTPDPLMSTYMFLERKVSTLPAPKQGLLFAVSQRGSITVERRTERDFELRSDAPMNSDVFSQLFRSTPYRVGETFPAGEITVTVLELDEKGWPRALRVHFNVPLDPARHRWIAWKHRGFVEESIPAVGETLVIPSTPWMEAMGL